MHAKQLSILSLLSLSLFWAQAAHGADWKPAPGPLTTPWTDKVDPKSPLPDYPRPQMVRAGWVNLNGLWDYAITKLAAPQPTAMDGKILVPFCVESALSGVKKVLKPTQRLWYHRTFDAPALARGKRLLLHFGAVDWEAKVSVNGKAIGEHRGGYDAFSFDITDAIKPGQNDLVVSVFDATGNAQPKGKQFLGAVEHPGGIMYTPCSGIWQTVWLETVSTAHVTSLKIVPDLDNHKVRVVVNCEGANDKTRVEVAIEDPTIGERSGTTTSRPHVVVDLMGHPGEAIDLPMDNANLWSPEKPFLYDIQVRVRNEKDVADEVRSYFGMRKIALGKDEKGILRPMFNNKFVFQSGPLDQGFWPDGIYTAPTDEALKFDIEITKKLGFNMTRKHTKVEPARWYYWCDKLGLLVWQDMPAGDVGKGAGKDNATGKMRDGTAVSPEAGKQHQAELKAMIEQHWNSPSIVMWIVFNEGWGQYDTVRLTNWTKELDPSRLVSNTSGWHDIKAGDIIDMHNYPGPGSPKPEANRAAVLGEFGGLGLPVPGHQWVDKTWGYSNMPDAATLTRKYLDLWKKVAELKADPGLSAAVYTQLTDVETESNGLLTYDRRVTKVDLEAASAAVAKGQFPPMPEVKAIKVESKLP